MGPPPGQGAEGPREVGPAEAGRQPDDGSGQGSGARHPQGGRRQGGRPRYGPARLPRQLARLLEGHQLGDREDAGEQVTLPSLSSRSRASVVGQASLLARRHAGKQGCLPYQKTAAAPPRRPRPSMSLPHRYLVSFGPKQTPHLFTDLLVIGAGIAGLRAALEVPPNLDVLVVTKDSLQQSNSAFAQG